MNDITLILPVYNTAPWLGRCLDSLQAQSFRNFECICIDDGSNDGSAAILQEHASRDPRIRIISFPENKGVCAARNAGLDSASGEYVCFVDSDDWLDPDFLESMHAHAARTGQDVVVNCNYIEEHGDRRAFSSDFGFVRPDDGYYSPAQVQSMFPPVLWARLYRRNFLESMKIRFPYLLAGTEDIFFTGLAETLQERSYIFHGPYYHYLQRPGSLLHQKEHGLWNIISFEYLYRSWSDRGVPTEDFRLFYAGPMNIDRQEVFDRIRPFLMEIAPQVRFHPEKYVGHDLFLMEAVCSSKDYTDFRSRYASNTAVAFVRERMKKHQQQ